MSRTVPLTADEARRLVLTAQGLIGRAWPIAPASSATASLDRRRGAVRSVLHGLGAVQLDTISVLARSHELVPYARLGPVGRAAVDTAYWGTDDEARSDQPAESFEYWSHAACVLPADMWPWFAFRRRHYQRRGERWHEVPRSELDGIMRRLREEGPLTTRDVGGAKSGGEWWDWSQSKVALEWLLDIGEVVCSRRVGWRRVYDLPDRALHPSLLERGAGASTTWSSADDISGPIDDECLRHLIALSARVMGVGTVTDLFDVHRISARYTSRTHLTAILSDLVDDGQITPVTVPGWRGPVYADSTLLAAGPARGRHRTTLLSPFDSLIWHRGRTERVFDFAHLFEPYVPAAKRQHGYFTMPVLHGGQLIARIDPKREGRELVAKAVHFETADGTGAPNGVVSRSAIDGTASALAEAAAWVGCERVRLTTVRPASAAASLASALDAIAP